MRRMCNGGMKFYVYVGMGVFYYLWSGIDFCFVYFCLCFDFFLRVIGVVDGINYFFCGVFVCGWDCDWWFYGDCIEWSLCFIVVW